MAGGGVTTERIALKGRRALLKICPSSSKECTRRLANEKSALFAAGKEVKVPSILAYGKKKVGRAHHSYLLLESIRGAPFVPSRDWRTASDYLCTLHRRTAWKHPAGVKKIDDPASHFVKKASQRIPLLKKYSVPHSLAKEARNLFSEAKKAASIKSEVRFFTLTNAYSLPHNWVKTPTGIALCDWSHASFTSPSSDLSIFLSPFSLSWRSPSQFSPDAQHEFLSGYLSGFSSGEQEEIETQVRRCSVPASAYLLLLALTEPSASAGKHFRNVFFVKKAAAGALRGLPSF